VVPQDPQDGSKVFALCGRWRLVIVVELKLKMAGFTYFVYERDGVLIHDHRSVRPFDSYHV
jgi:hypothetical protein